jgi:hypothetical protein
MRIDTAIHVRMIAVNTSEYPAAISRLTISAYCGLV